MADVVDRYCRTVKGKLEHRNWSSIESEGVTGNALRVWYMRWPKSGRRIGALAPLTHKQGKLEPSRLDPAIVALIHDAVSQKWLTLEAPPARRASSA
ncbi:hypothetical protein [Rhodopseudomonas sp.]|uniref:hypothetical protein n=1 Tax=Rhodopseudomonas sp. TaxID=1078 RepID=UPI0039E6D6B0